MYIHELHDWPEWRWSSDQIATLLADVRHQQGRLIGHMGALGFSLQREAVLETLTVEVVKSSEIEGETLDAEQVRSSVARHLGLDIGALRPTDRHVEGIVEMMLDATSNYPDPLSVERLYSWHAALFPTGRSGLRTIHVGAWRDDSDGPMQVVSGPMGRERVHFEAPAASRIDREIAAFLEWFNGRLGIDDVLKAALAHLWFVTIHPFDDGNGRIARAITDMALARSEASTERYYSMSARIRDERNDYYAILEHTQKGTMDVTPWIEWFLTCMSRAIDAADGILRVVLQKSQVWQRIRGHHLNERQIAVINRLLDGFVGKLTTSKYATLAKCSQDTALRDINELLDQGILIRGPEGGRSTNYVLVDQAEEFNQSQDGKPGPTSARTGW